VVVLLAVMAAAQVAAMRDEESRGRLDNLLVRPVPRVGWLAGRVAMAVGQLLVVGLAAGVVTWVAAASQHTGVPLHKLVEAGMNATVPALFVLGAGVLVLGVVPRAASAAGYAIVAYSLVVSLVGALIKGHDWVRDTSLFSHVALAPAAKPDWQQVAVLLLVAVAAAVAGAVAFRRRDIAYA
jgi:ABC-2 type transport system permease protein